MCKTYPNIDISLVIISRCCLYILVHMVIFCIILYTLWLLIYSRTSCCCFYILVCIVVARILLYALTLLVYSHAHFCCTYILWHIVVGHILSYTLWFLVYYRRHCCCSYVLVHTIVIACIFSYELLRDIFSKDCGFVHVYWRNLYQKFIVCAVSPSSMTAFFLFGSSWTALKQSS